MPTQGERQNYLWRPNDNSATTRVRYDLEAEHWTRAFRSAEMNSRSSSFSSDMQTIGLVLGLAINLVWITVLLITEGIKWLLPLIDQNPEKGNLESGVSIGNGSNTSSKALAIDKSNAIKKIETLIANRPSSDISSRDDLFGSAATLVVNRQEASLTLIMYELKLEFERAIKIIDDLYESGIISRQIMGYRRKVFIDSKVSLDLFFEVERKLCK